MQRTIVGIAVGLLAWIIVATLLNFILRAAIPGYHQAEPTLAFTLPMKIGRLAEALVASFTSGAVAQRVSTQPRVALIVGIIVLAVFLPLHISIGSKLPLWYHLFFLFTIIPAVLLGSTAAGASTNSRP